MSKFAKWIREARWRAVDRDVITKLFLKKIAKRSNRIEIHRDLFVRPLHAKVLDLGGRSQQALVEPARYLKLACSCSAR
jgi:hypothetical protein